MVFCTYSLRRGGGLIYQAKVDGAGGRNPAPVQPYHSRHKKKLPFGSSGNVADEADQPRSGAMGKTTHETFSRFRRTFMVPQSEPLVKPISWRAAHPPLGAGGGWGLPHEVYPIHLRVFVHHAVSDTVDAIIAV